MIIPDPDRFLDRLHGLAVDLVRPRAGEIDSADTYPDDLQAQFAAEGLLSLTLPAELGGPGPGEPSGVTALTRATEVMAQHSSAAGLMLLLSRLPAAPILLGGTPEQQRQLLVPLGRGQ